MLLLQSPPATAVANRAGGGVLLLGAVEQSDWLYIGDEVDGNPACKCYTPVNV